MDRRWERYVSRMVRHRHAKKIEAVVEDHIPRLMRWYVIECRCGWSSALHAKKDEALTAYQAHRARDNRKKKAA